MRKYLFMLRSSEYDRFLDDLQELGIVHLGKSKQPVSATAVKELADELAGIEKTYEFLKKYQNKEKDEVVSTKFIDYNVITESVLRLKNVLELETTRLGQLNKSIEMLGHWGDFSPDTISLLNKKGIQVRFYLVHEKKFDQNWVEKNPVEIISKGRKIRFVYLGNTQVDFTNAVEEKPPFASLTTFLSKKNSCQENIDKANADLRKIASNGMKILEIRIKEIRIQLEWHDVRENLTSPIAEGKVLLLEGWVPEPEENALQAYLERYRICYLRELPGPGDNPPVKLKNSWFGKLFEPVTSLFALPEYRELDLTVYFAPFFMLFFGFCLGDAGYGLVLLAVSSLGKSYVKKNIKGFLTLGQLFGASTFVMGLVFGTFFGIDLSKVALLGSLKGWFLDSSQIFSLSLIVGGVQIVYGIILRIFNQLRHESPILALSSGGWLLLIFTTVFSVISAGSENVLRLPGIVTNLLYTVSLIMIIFFTEKGPVHMRLLGGIWGIYNTVTGIFGDLLSYIRLFALGIASSILGLVINQMAVSFGEAQYVGPLIFFLIVVIGHTANLAISSLGAFVHPMRLTFVEFYKNAGFKGTGKPFIAFSKNI